MSLPVLLTSFALLLGSVNAAAEDERLPADEERIEASDDEVAHEERNTAVALQSQEVRVISTKDEPLGEDDEMVSLWVVHNGHKFLCMKYSWQTSWDCMLTDWNWSPL